MINILLLTGEVDDSKVSNLLEVTLPLYVSEIVLPPEGKRLEEEELYLEYIEIHEGSGYLQAMDGKIIFDFVCMLVVIFCVF